MKLFNIIFILISIFELNILKQEFGLFSENEDFVEIIINGEKSQEFDIKGNISYIFTIINEKYFYCFTSSINNIFYIKNENSTYQERKNDTFFGHGEKIYVNHLKKNFKDTKIKISPFNIYNELNSMETIKENQYFFIKSENKSIAYFDSFDKNSKVYLSKSREKPILPEDQRINGKFQEIAPNEIYLIKNIIFDTSVYKKYFYPIISNESIINIKNDDINFFYLGKNDIYTLNFEQNSKNIMIKLSTKTSNSKIKIIKNEQEIKELNKNSPYFILNKKYLGEIKLKIEECDAFIEFLFNYGEYEILTDEIRMQSKINKNIQIIKLPLTQKSFKIEIKSNKNFKYSLSLGLTNNENYFYSSSSNIKINTQNNEEILIYYSLFKNINILKDEFITITINFEKEENQDIFISYRQFSEMDEIIDEKLDKEKCKQIINLLQTLFKNYIYQDIAQNPPDIGIPNYHHRKINLIKEIGSIPTENRKFYEFFQEIKLIISEVRDGHIDIFPFETPSGIDFKHYGAYLPFNYVMKKYKGEIRLFISIKNNFIMSYDNYTQEILKSHEEIPIKTINDKDPFDYIQNWSNLSLARNPHTNFGYNLIESTQLQFIIYPLNYSDLVENEFEFDDNHILRISYQIIKPEHSLQFKEFFLKNSKKFKLNKGHLLSPFYRTKNKNKISHFNKRHKYESQKNDDESIINWDILYEEGDGYIKCRVDDKKEVNVFVQNSFYLKYGIAAGLIFKCAELFHLNKYPIIIIEDQNDGGDPRLAYLIIQLFQMRGVERSYSALRYTENLPIFDQDADLGNSYYFNPDTCQKINRYEELGMSTDYYDYNGLNIEHKRTNVYVEIHSLNERKGFNKFREEYQNSDYLKKPTDIIVFTDGLSFSAASSLIKGFQNIGGAIIVGYAGNPKIEGTDLFDGSQSDSGVSELILFEEYYKLKKLGYEFGSLTIGETFDDSYKNQNPIPREYTMNPIDYRVDIYSFYSDDLYNEFIEKGKEVHKKFNQDKYCNYRNQKLFLYNDNKCKNFEKLEHAHGGFKCGENNQWSNECSPYYCDIGYSFDQLTKQCVKDCMVDWPVNFIYKDDISEIYNIKKNEKLEFITLNPNGLYYVFESSENVIKGFPKISFIKGNQNVIINNDKNSTNDIKLEINTVETNLDIINLKSNAILIDKVMLLEKNKMLIFYSDKEHVLFFNKILNNSDINQIKYLKYNSSIKYQDILNINEKIFTNYLGNSFILEKGQTYILFLDNNNSQIIDATINPLEENMILKISSINYLYLQKGKTYTLLISNDIENMMIKLSRETLNSEITINENNKLNSNNLYYLYKYNDIDKGILKLKIDKNDAKIEFLYNLTNDSFIENINYEKSIIKLTNEINILKIPKEFKNVNINITIFENDEYSLYQGYSIPPFSHYFDIDDNNRISSNYSINIFEPYNSNIKLMDNEFYTVIIRLHYIQSEIYLNINGVKGKNNDEDSENMKGLKWYEIALIGVGVLFIIIIIIIVLIFIIKRIKRMENESIEEKIGDLDAVDN